MLVRYGVAHVVAVVVALLLVVLGIAIWGAVDRRLAPGKAAGRGSAKALSGAIGLLARVWLLAGFVTPFILFLGWPTVWLVEDDPETGALAYRRYKLWAGDAVVETAGKSITVGISVEHDRGPQNGELDIVVNGTRAPLVIDPIQYGQNLAAPRPDARRLAPGEWWRERHLNGVGEAPATMQVSKNAPTGSMVWVHR